MRKQPPSRNKVLAFIAAEIGAGNSFPTSVQIRQHMNWKENYNVGDILTSLICEGESAGEKPKAKWEILEVRVRTDRGGQKCLKKSMNAI